MNSPETNGCIRNLLACQYDLRRLRKSHDELLAVLQEAELDCRGEEALHGWVEKAWAVIAKAEAL